MEQTIEAFKGIFFSIMMICTFLFFYDVYMSDDINKSVVIEKDTLTIVNFDLTSNCYMLSDGTYCKSDVEFSKRGNR